MSVATSKARLAGLVAHRDPADPAISRARAELKAANLEAAIRDAVATWPPLTGAQRDQLALLLRPDGGTDGLPCSKPRR